MPILLTAIRAKIIQRVICLTIVLATFSMAPAQGEEISIGGFIPFVGLGLTDQFKDGNDLSALFFLTDRETSYAGTPLTGSNPSFVHDIALLDTGAATHILTAEASGANGFDINGNGFDGTNIQRIGGATGTVDLNINDPHGVYASGLGNRTSEGNTLQIDTATFRGQSSFATLSAPNEWKLPNIIGLPMAAQHKIVIRNDAPQVFQHKGRTVRTPDVEFKDLGSGGEGIVRRTNLKLRPGTSFITGPLYVQSLDFSGGKPHENPTSPSILENAALFVDIDMQNEGIGFEDKEFLFDTGADFTVISSLTAARLGFDAVLDTPDFLLEVEGSGGVQDGVPGFYVDRLNIDTVGGTFTLHNVPVAVFDVTNPNDPGNIIDGILGMHLFNGRNLVIDTNPSIGQGGIGPSLYIGDKVTTTHVWTSNAASATWHSGSRWSTGNVPDLLAETKVGNVTGSHQTVRVTQNAVANTLSVAGTPTATTTLAIESGAILTTFGETKITEGGRLHVEAGGKLDTQFVNIEGGILTGSGELFVGTGPLSSPVRNIAGRVEPGDTIGRLSIDGDFSNLELATLAIDLGGTVVATEYDQLDVTRFAFLGGTLEVSLADLGGGLFAPEVGNSFTLLTAGESVHGMFDDLQLPGGYEWDIAYNAQDVVLSVTALLASLLGDFNLDGSVDAADYTVWRDGLGTTYTVADYTTWKTHFGENTVGASVTVSTAVPEPATAGLLLLLAVGFALPLTQSTHFHART